MLETANMLMITITKETIENYRSLTAQLLLSAKHQPDAKISTEKI